MATTLQTTKPEARTARRVRTSIELDEDLIEEARQLSGLTTKREIVNEALKEYVRIMKQRAGLKLFGKLPWDGDLAEIRRGRHFTIDR